MKKPTKEEAELYKETAKILKGTDRRVFMARVVKTIMYPFVKTSKVQFLIRPLYDTDSNKSLSLKT